MVRDPCADNAITHELLGSCIRVTSWKLWHYGTEWHWCMIKSNWLHMTLYMVINTSTRPKHCCNMETASKKDDCCSCSCHRCWWYCKSCWVIFVKPLLDAATELCGLSKNHQWRAKTWWWNEPVDEAVHEKRARFKAYNALKKGGMPAGTKGQKLSTLKPSVWQSLRRRKRIRHSTPGGREFVTVPPDGDGVFRITKQMDGTN